MSRFVPADNIRASFAAAMSRMYQAEVPLYGDLIDIVETVNARAIRADPALARSAADRIGVERHGAIRVGTAAELAAMRRVFAVMGMAPVGYYDLAPAGVPVHSTAFRPVEPEALARNPFRVFTSLLRLELIEDEQLRERAAAILAGRRIFTDAAIMLVERWEGAGGLGAEDAERFVAEVLTTFRWHGDALVDRDTYRRLHDAHRLVADVVSFRGPHINHLTPRTLDIDAAQAEMTRLGMPAKAVIEGPPSRRVPILLRQTSFMALEEAIRFPGEEGQERGTHTARFGEIEQRGIALTRKGRALYDALLDEAQAGSADGYQARLARAFERLPDDADTLRRAGLAFFRYRAADHATLNRHPRESGDTSPEGRSWRSRQEMDSRFRGNDGGRDQSLDLERLIDSGRVVAEPITYEDFLPVSAAGIFRSNLGGEAGRGYATDAAQAEFERALGAPVLDPFALYEAIERESLAAIGFGAARLDPVFADDHRSA